ncbi:histidine kinase [Agrobacterium vaccinii]|uniref:5'-methylthioadenosine/S-adenosylhomocysteine nucleosidase family protein n=1 Tax=Agrobacterium vaccinii TaxID=2735528 RepID=UPI001E597B80|nr:histidine kinase [Agrobacterium vaccinii]UHS55580.1 hypothetical protein HRS00_01465 [Agrobacterium vaccinii]
MKILVVEDNHDKLTDILNMISSIPNCSLDDVDDARDSASGLRLLRENQYDLLILDLLLPERRESSPSIEGGLNLLKQLSERSIYCTPSHIIGLTADAAAQTRAEPEFKAHVLQIVHYDQSSRDWSDRITRAIRRIQFSLESREKSAQYDYDLAIITALKSPELDAVLNLPWNWEARASNADPTTYQIGYTTTSSHRQLRVVAATAPRMGMPASAALASKMIHQFRPRYLVMTGILAGIRGKVNFGDVVVADPAWDYGSGKRYSRKGRGGFEAAPHQVSLDAFTRSRLSRFSSDQPAIDEIKRRWQGDKPMTELKVHFGPVASGASVLEDSEMIRTIIDQHRKVIGVEMETYGIFVAAEESIIPQPSCFSIKSVCDFADEEKNDNYQKFASYTSASVLNELTMNYLFD